jgi:hypothetical protein
MENSYKEKQANVLRSGLGKLDSSYFWLVTKILPRFMQNLSIDMKESKPLEST